MAIALAYPFSRAKMAASCCLFSYDNLNIVGRVIALVRHMQTLLADY